MTTNLKGGRRIGAPQGRGIRPYLNADHPKDQLPLDVKRLDRAMAALGLHVDLKNRTREVGCWACYEGIAAIAKAYGEDA